VTVTVVANQVTVTVVPIDSDCSGTPRRCTGVPVGARRASSTRHRARWRKTGERASEELDASWREIHGESGERAIHGES